MFTKDNRSIFAVRYNVDEQFAGAKDVSLCAEVSENLDDPDRGAYSLEIFIDIKSITFRNHFFGKPFGHKGMDKDEFLKVVEDSISEQLDSSFPKEIQRMFRDAIMRGEVPYADGGTVVCVTDPDWLLTESE